MNTEGIDPMALKVVPIISNAGLVRADGGGAIAVGQMILTLFKNDCLENDGMEYFQGVISKAVIFRIVETIGHMADRGSNYSNFTMFENDASMRNAFRCHLFRIDESSDRYQFMVEKKVVDSCIDITDLYQAACYRILSNVFPGFVHDIRGRLNSIVVDLELTKSAVDLAYKGAPSVIEEGSQNLLRMPIKQVYNLDKSLQMLLEILDPTPGIQEIYDIREILEDVYGLVKTTARLKGIKFVWRPSQDSMPVEGEKSVVRRSLFHIVMTTVEATKKGGTLYGSTLMENNHYVVAINGARDEFEHQDLDILFNATLAEFAIDRNTVAVYMARNALSNLGGTTLLNVDSEKFELRIGLPKIQDV